MCLVLFGEWGPGLRQRPNIFCHSVLKVEILDRKRIRFMKGQPSDLWGNSKGHMDEIIERGFVLGKAPVAAVMRMQIAHATQALDQMPTGFTNEMPLHYEEARTRRMQK